MRLAMECLDRKLQLKPSEICSSGGETKQSTEEIVWSITSGAADERLRAIREVRRVTKTSPKSRVYLAAAGVIAPLVLLLKSSCHDTQEAALLALLNLSVGNERNKVKIVKSGAIQPLVVLLQSEIPSLRESAAAAIYTLSAASSNKSVIGSSGAAPWLVEMLSSGSVQGKVDAVMALYNLSTLQDNRAAILAARPVAPLLLLLKSCKKSGNVADKAISVLESLASAFEDGRSAIGKVEGGILTLVEVLEDGSSKGRELAVKILLTLCQANRIKYREAILQEGVIPGLLELTVQGTPKAQEMAHRLLELLRESPSRSSDSSSTCSSLHSIASDIASHIDGEDLNDTSSARRLLSEMVRLSMEQSLRHLQQRAFSRAPSSVSGSSEDPSSSPSE